MFASDGGNAVTALGAALFCFEDIELATALPLDLQGAILDSTVQRSPASQAALFSFLFLQELYRAIKSQNITLTP